MDCVVGGVNGWPFLILMDGRDVDEWSGVECLTTSMFQIKENVNLFLDSFGENKRRANSRISKHIELKPHRFR